MEVATGQRFVGVTEDQRVVGHAIGLGLQQLRGVVQHIETRPHDLRLAAQAIGVLHPLIALQVRGANGAAAEQLAQGLGGGDLPPVLAQAVNTGIKRRVGALGGIGGQGPREQRRLEQALGFKQTGQCVGGGKLCAIEQGQPFFGPQCYRGQAHAGQRLFGGHTALGRVGIAHTDHHGGHVRQRRQIARGPDRALTGHHRDDSFGQHGFE